MRLPPRATYLKQTKLRGYNVPVNVMTAVGSDGGKILVRRLPSWCKTDHLAAAKKLAKKATTESRRWGRIAEAAAKETFGRGYRFTDYRISAIGRDEFSPTKKDALRKAARGASFFRTAAHAHESASRRARRCA
jgi:hypothetical protein